MIKSAMRVMGLVGMVAFAVAAQAQVTDVYVEPPRTPMDGFEAMLNQPQIPMPDTDDFTLGNRAQIEQNNPAKARACALYAQEKPKAPTEIDKARQQKKQYDAFFIQINKYLIELAIQRNAALNLVKQYRERKMDEAQIALVERQAKLLDEKYKQEQARRSEASRKYDQINARQVYYLNIDDHFPDCYDRYPEKENTEILSLMNQLVREDAAKTGAKAAPLNVTDPRQLPNSTSR